MRQIKRPAADSAGAALVLVLWVLTLLTVISAEFCRSMRTETNISRNYRDLTQSYYAALGGINLAIYQVSKQDNPSVPPTQEPETDEDEPAPWRINADLPPVEIGSAQAHIRIENEGGKVNINLADAGLLQMLLSGLDITDEERRTIVDSIMDWRDADPLHRLNGAEDDYYQSLPDPYPCKNGDFDSIDELLRVKGVTAELYDTHLRYLITVFPSRAFMQEKYGWREGEKRPEGVFDYNRININAAGPMVLAALPGLGEEGVEAIAAYREEKDFRSNRELIEAIGPEAFDGIKMYVTYDLTPYYRIRVQASKTNGDAVRRIGTLVHIATDPDHAHEIVRWFDHIRPDDGRWGIVQPEPVES